MRYNTLQYTVANGIGFLFLSSPPKNAMTLEFYDEFYHFTQEIKKDKQLKGLIIQGKGRHFSSGADTGQLFSLFKSNENQIPPEIAKNSTAFSNLTTLPFPTVSCIKGVCLGAGTELALCTHFRIATESALLGLPETGFDIIPGLGGIYNMYACAGKYNTLQLILTGNSISAKNSYNMGIIDILVPKKELEATAINVIHSIGDTFKKEYKATYLKNIKEE